MSAYVEWGNSDKTILIQHFQGDWTVADYYQVVDDSFAYITSVSHEVHVITDLTANTSPPSRLMTAANYANKRVAPNHGVLVIVKTGRFLDLVIGVIQKVSPYLTKHLYFAESMTEAYAIITRETSREN